MAENLAARGEGLAGLAGLREALEFIAGGNTIPGYKGTHPDERVALLQEVMHAAQVTAKEGLALLAALEAAAPPSTGRVLEHMEGAEAKIDELHARQRQLEDALRAVNSLQHQMAIELDPIPQQPRIEFWTRKMEDVIVAALATPSPQAPREQFEYTCKRCSGSGGFGGLQCPDCKGEKKLIGLRAAATQSAGSGHVDILAELDHEKYTGPMGKIMQVGSPRKVGEDGQPATKIWTCKIGEITQERFANLPNGLDFPMRIAIKEAYERITGKEPNFCFSGWGGTLNEGERAVVENRPPNAARSSSVPVGEQKESERGTK